MNSALINNGQILDCHEGYLQVEQKFNHILFTKETKIKFTLFLEENIINVISVVCPWGLFK